MNLYFIAEHTADPESIKTILRNRITLLANPPICDTWGQEMSEVKIGRRFERMAMPKTKKSTRKEFLKIKVENQGIKD